MRDYKSRPISEAEAFAIKQQLIKAQNHLENVDVLEERLANHDKQELERAWKLINEIIYIVLD